MRSCSLVLLAAGLGAGCGPGDANRDGIVDGVREPNNVSLVAPSTPVGTLSGQLLTTRLSPLEDAQVSLNVGGTSSPAASGDQPGAPWVTSTDAEGHFAFSGIPAGSQVLVTMTKKGFATLRATATIPASAGNFPINNANASVGPFSLTELNGELKALVIGSSGRPAKGARAVLEATPAGTRLDGSSSGYGSPTGIVVAEAVADDSGVLSFSAIPAPSELARLSGLYVVTLAALDENQDGIYDSAGKVVTFTAASLVVDPSPRLIQLPSARSPGNLQLVTSNVASLYLSPSPPLENLIKPGESLYVVFSQAVQDSSLLVRLTDETGTQSLPVARSIGTSGSVVAIQPAAPLEKGREYNLSVRAVSLDSGSFVAATGYFFVGDPADPLPLGGPVVQYRDDAPNNGTLSPGEVVTVAFNQPLGVVGTAGPLYAYLNYDLDGFGGVGNAQGEKGFAGPGFPVTLAEPVNEPGALFPLRPSGYSSTYRFTYSSGSNQVTNQTEVVIAFGRVANGSGGYQTIWGQAVTDDKSAGVTFAP